MERASLERVREALSAALGDRYTIDRELGRGGMATVRSEEHTSELQSLAYLVCRLLLEKKKSQSKENLAFRMPKAHQEYIDHTLGCSSQYWPHPAALIDDGTKTETTSVRLGLHYHARDG